MNMFRAMAQSFLVAVVLFVGNTMASDEPSLRDKIAQRIKGLIGSEESVLSIYWDNPTLFPVTGVFILSSCREGSANAKAMSTLAKTALFSRSKYGQEMIHCWYKTRLSAFAVADAGVRFAAEYVGKIEIVRDGVAKIEGIVGKKVVNLAKEVAVGYAAYRITNYGFRVGNKFLNRYANKSKDKIKLNDKTYDKTIESNNKTYDKTIDKTIELNNNNVGTSDDSSSESATK